MPTMEFKCTETVKFPLPLVWSTMRDRLPEIAAQQDDIEYVRVEKRTKKTTASVHVISTWKSDPPLPSFLKSFIKADMLIWTDDAIWDNDETTCHFTIITHYKVENIQCVGTIECKSSAAGKSTKIVYSGTLSITKTPKSSIFMTGFVIKGIEAVASSLIETNFAKVIKAITQAIKEEK